MRLSSRIVLLAVLSLPGLSLPLSGPAHAGDPGLGIGLTWIFGGGGGGGEFALGIRALSTREEDKAAAVLGLDYNFSAGSWRPALGIAAIGDGYFADATFGYDLSSQRIDFGIGIGGVNSKGKAPPPPPPAGGGGGGGGI